MKKKVSETVTIEKVKVVQVSCNKCGKSLKVNENECIVDDRQNEPHEFVCDFGYYSSFDGERWNFDLCETCLVELVKSFKLVPDGFMIDRDYIQLEKDHQRIFEKWKSTGKWESFLGYTIEDLESLRGIFKDEYIDELIEKCKLGELE